MGFHAVTSPSTREDLSIEDQLATNVGLEMQKNMFFSNHVFYAKKKVFFIEKNSFLMFFLIFFLITKIFN